MELPKEATYGDLYHPAMRMTTTEEAAPYFAALVDRLVKHYGKTREEAESIERQNLGYFAGYYDHETRIRVESLFSCQHPIFGAASKGAPIPEEAFAAGVAIARSTTE